MSGQAGWKTVEPAWEAVDRFVADTLLGDDEALEFCLSNSECSGLPDIAVSPAQARFLETLVRIAGARRVLEIGTLGGFSTIHLARGAGPEGRVTTLEYDPAFADVARSNIERAGLSQRIDVVTGAALDTLPDLDPPFDLVFIDADKVNNIAYVDHAVRLGKTGALIIVDNVVREGGVLEPADDSARASRALYDHVAAHPRLSGSVLQTVGAKGWDGMMMLELDAPCT